MPRFTWYIAQVIKQHETKNNKQNMNTYFVYALHKHFKVLNVLVKIIRAMVTFNISLQLIVKKSYKTCLNCQIKK